MTKRATIVVWVETDVPEPVLALSPPAQHDELLYLVRKMLEQRRPGTHIKAEVYDHETISRALEGDIQETPMERFLRENP